MTDLIPILKKKYDSGQLAQVYLAYYLPEASPLYWVNDFLKTITKVEDHPDVLWVTRNEKETLYKVDSQSIKEMLRFLNFRPIELKRRFIFIADAHLISDIVANKLLKVLEELPEAFCLFLFAPNGEILLPTIESRALKLKLPRPMNVDEFELPPFDNVQDLITFLKTSPEPQILEKKFIERSLSLRLSKDPNYEQLDELLSSLKHFSESLEYNNARASRLSLLFP